MKTNPEDYDLLSRAKRRLERGLKRPEGIRISEVMEEFDNLNNIEIKPEQQTMKTETAQDIHQTALAIKELSLAVKALTKTYGKHHYIVDKAKHKLINLIDTLDTG